MFTIRWVVHRHETEKTMSETSDLPDADSVVASCLERLPHMKLEHVDAPPDGFLIFDENNQEVRRWFGSARP